MSNYTNLIFCDVLKTVMEEGDDIETRNFLCKSHIHLESVCLYEFPLVTVRKTMWFKAIQEMEWFMSGNEKCPDVLTNWWKGQLNPEGRLINGYSKQYREYTHVIYDPAVTITSFDQIAHILDSLKNHPNSRRMVLTAWNPAEMSEFTKINNNPNAPTCCHSSLIQFFVREGMVHTHHYVRSQDLLLGTIHNWVQHWALLMYFAYHSGLEVGNMVWSFGDAHIYQDETHIKTVEELLAAVPEDGTSRALDHNVDLVYNYSGQVDSYGTPKFLASDFSITGEIPAPVTTIKPRLL